MIITTAMNMTQAMALLQAGADSVLLPVNNGLSIRQDKGLDLSELKEAAQKIHDIDKKIYVNAMKIIHNDDLPKALELLEAAKEAEIDGIYVSDEAWQILKRQSGYTGELVYQPETLMTNGLDAQFYIDHGFEGVCLAHELSLEEIKECASECLEVEVLVHGYYSWFSSRRNLISNYISELEDRDVQVDREVPRFIREVQRDSWMRIEERDYGTTIWSDAPISSFEEIGILNLSGVHRFRIDTSFLPFEQSVQIVKTYKEILDSKLSPQEVEESLKGNSSLYYVETLTKKGKD